MKHKNKDKKKDDEFKKLISVIRLNKEQIGGILLDMLYVHPEKDFPTLNSLKRIIELDALASRTMDKYKRLREIINEEIKDIV